MTIFRRLFALLLLPLLAACTTTAPLAPGQRPVLLISVDGLRADVVGPGALPTRGGLAHSGARARWMTPSYPSLPVPNHYTLGTGLRPDHHGIGHTTMRDPALGGFSLRDRDAVQDARWW